MHKIRELLFAAADLDYAKFNARLIPNIDPERIIGVRSPKLRSIAAGMEAEDRRRFLSSLPHFYHEENMLHAYLTGRMKEPEEIIAQLDAFLPFVDNWAVCDCLRPAALKKQPALLLSAVERWLASEHGYTVRFGLGMLMSYFLGELFEQQYPAMAASVQSEDYYVNMMQAWYFATALAKQWDAVIPYIREHRLSPWVHNKAIQKAVESYRISAEQKAYLRTLR